MKVLGKLLFIILLILCVLVLARNFILKVGIEQGVGLVTGLRLHMQSLSVGIRETHLQIKELKIHNPPGYEQDLMLHMPEILIDYNLSSILKGNIHLESVVINLTEFNVVKNKDGKLNLDVLPTVKEGKKKKAKPAEPKEKKEGAPLKFQIDDFQLILGRVSFQDYSKKPEPSLRSFDMNIDEHHQNITSPQVITAIILQKVLMKASLAKLSGFELGGINDVVSGQLPDFSAMGTKAMESATGSVDELSGIGSKTVDSAKETAEKASQAVKEQAAKLKGLTKKIKLPLGGE